MFGYVRPVREELKCKILTLFVHILWALPGTRRKYGLLAPMFLNFDFTFLALLLWPAEQRFVPAAQVPRQSAGQKGDVSR